MSAAIAICVCIFISQSFAETGLRSETYDTDIRVNQIRECVNHEKNKRVLVDPTFDQLGQKLSNFVRGNTHNNKREASTNAGKHKISGRPKSKKGEKKGETDQQWDAWTTWSGCSVTCGKGRHIRWRHCRKHCRDVETEMEQKLCQLPACPRKLFGLIKL